MEASQSVPQTSSRPWISNSSTATSTPTISMMNDLPAQLTPAQAEAQDILKNLLSRLGNPESTYYSRYGKWVERHPRLGDLCFRCVRPQVWTYLNGRWSLDAIKAIGGDLRSNDGAVYLNGILGLDKSMRLYVGQASSVRHRIAQHLNFRYRRDNPSLHYYALQHSTYNAIGLLAVPPSLRMGGHALPGMDDPKLLLNVLEMWMGLVFGSLPESMLLDWSPGGVDIKRKEGKEGVFGGLNIRCPLDQGDSKSDWIDLSKSDDPLVRAYLGAGTPKTAGKLDEATDVVDKRKKEYSEKARKLNMSQARPGQLGNTLIIFGIGIVLGFALTKGLSGPIPRR